MTPAEVLDMAAVAGCEVYLRPTGQPAVRGNVPNAALMAALKDHRAGIIRLLGGVPEPERCGGYVVRVKVKDEWVERQVECGAVVFEAEDGDFFCDARARCPFRRRVRGHG